MYSGILVFLNLDLCSRAQFVRIIGLKLRELARCRGKSELQYFKIVY